MIATGRIGPGPDPRWSMGSVGGRQTWTLHELIDATARVDGRLRRVGARFRFRVEWLGSGSTIERVGRLQVYDFDDGHEVTAHVEAGDLARLDREASSRMANIRGSLEDEVQEARGGALLAEVFRDHIDAQREAIRRRRLACGLPAEDEETSEEIRAFRSRNV